jgi:hypothetical protein
MRKNIVYNVASAFDLETEECFKISGYDGFFYFAVDCLRQVTNTGDEEADAILAKIVMGDVDVIKFPWKPKQGEANGSNCSNCSSSRVDDGRR